MFADCSCDRTAASLEYKQPGTGVRRGSCRGSTVAYRGLPASNHCRAFATTGRRREREQAPPRDLGRSGGRITVNLAPADLPKEGSHYDLRAWLIGGIRRPRCHRRFLATCPRLDRTVRRSPAAPRRRLSKGLICPLLMRAPKRRGGHPPRPDLLVLVNHFKGLQTLRRPEPTPDRAALWRADLQTSRPPEVAG